VKGGRARALVVNAGNSNAFTGYRGREAVEADHGRRSPPSRLRRSEVFVSSTGVIGVPCPRTRRAPG
jgi:glutamate N-acetyltransferase/amino-acid N-acetyltransferase